VNLLRVNNPRIISEETRKKMSESATGKKMSDESKEKNRIKHLKENISDETQIKMSESAKKRWEDNKESFNRTEETHKKMSESHKGKIGYWKDKKLSDETKKKMSESHKGKHSGKISEEHRLAIIEGIKKKKEMKNKNL
jgi:hypothetical protein